jgi:serine-type D-Ala-D-Ala carboxypeptidase/endopeptidase (penicillin-binding protein 4)
VNRRRAPAIHPVLVLCVVALLPAAGLWALWQWADGKAGTDDAVPPTSSTVVAAPAPGAPLVTPLASLRRVPVALAHDLNLEAFRADVQPLVNAVNDRSCVAVSLDGVDVGERNADLVVLPASVQKIVVAAAALELLGADHTFTTSVAGPTPVDGVVSGDVFLVGGGDPLLSSDWYPTSNLDRFPVFNQTSFDLLAAAVAASGVTRIDGSVVGDGTRYDDELYAPGWGSGVAGLEAGPYDALMANDSRVFGEPQRASEPVDAAAREFVRLLSEAGVDVTGDAGAGTAPGGLTELGSVTSQPLPAIIAEMLSTSDNNTAELLVKEIGVVTAGTGTREAGLAAIRTAIEGWGVDVSGVVLADGSGLSLDNRATCAVINEALQRDGVDGPIGQGLAVAGTSGTLIDVFVDGPVTGRLRGKTGTLNNPPFNADPPAVKSLAGYLPVDGGGAIEYTLILNGPTISDQSEYRSVWDALASALATYPSVAGPDILGPR